LWAGAAIILDRREIEVTLAGGSWRGHHTSGVGGLVEVGDTVNGGGAAANAEAKKLNFHVRNFL
jgi:hypothetical protein